MAPGRVLGSVRVFQQAGLEKTSPFPRGFRAIFHDESALPPVPRATLPNVN